MYKSTVTSVKNGDKVFENVEIKMIVSDTIVKEDGREIQIVTGFADLNNSGEAITMVVKEPKGWVVWASR